MRFQCIRSGDVLVMARCCRGARLDLRCKFARCSRLLWRTRSARFVINIFSSHFSQFIFWFLRLVHRCGERSMRWCAACSARRANARTSTLFVCSICSVFFVRFSSLVTSFGWWTSKSLFWCVKAITYCCLRTRWGKKYVCFAFRFFFFLCFCSIWLRIRKRGAITNELALAARNVAVYLYFFLLFFVPFRSDFDKGFPKRGRNKRLAHFTHFSANQ